MNLKPSKTTHKLPKPSKRQSLASCLNHNQKNPVFELQTSSNRATNGSYKMSKQKSTQSQARLLPKVTDLTKEMNSMTNEQFAISA